MIFLIQDYQHFYKNENEKEEGREKRNRYKHQAENCLSNATTAITFQ